MPEQEEYPTLTADAHNSVRPPPTPTAYAHHRRRRIKIGKIITTAADINIPLRATRPPRAVPPRRHQWQHRGQQRIVWCLYRRDHKPMHGHLRPTRPCPTRGRAGHPKDQVARERGTKSLARPSLIVMLLVRFNCFGVLTKIASDNITGQRHGEVTYCLIVSIPSSDDHLSQRQRDKH